MGRIISCAKCGKEIFVSDYDEESDGYCKKCREELKLEKEILNEN